MSGEAHLRIGPEAEELNDDRSLSQDETDHAHLGQPSHPARPRGPRRRDSASPPDIVPEDVSTGRPPSRSIPDITVLSLAAESSVTGWLPVQPS